MSTYKVVTVNYLNTRPFLEGIQRSSLIHKIDLDIVHPAACAEKMINNQCDIGLIPIAALPDLEEYQIISDYCLGCDGAVSSVCIFSERPLDKCNTLILDYQSRSSAAMVRYFQNHFWQYESLKLRDGFAGYEQRIKEDTAGLVIGDRCFEMKDTYPYMIDLGDEWKRYTGLPFTFAVWISREPIDRTFQIEFNQALKNGVQNLQWSAKPGTVEYEYLRTSISYPFDKLKREAFRLFLEYLEQELVATD